MSHNKEGKVAERWERADTGNTNAKGAIIRTVLFLGALAAAGAVGLSVLGKSGESNQQSSVSGPANAGGN